MNADTAKPKILNSDPYILRKIKIAQIKRQVLPIIIMILFIIANLIYPSQAFLVLTIGSFGWFLWERAVFRTKNKILAPEEDTFVAPFDGKVISIRRNEDMTILTLKKAIIDVVELRLPYPNPSIEKPDTWQYNTPMGSIMLHFKAKKMKLFEHKNIVGSVIGMIPNSGQVTIYLPAKINLKVKPNDVIFGGETVLFDFKEEPITIQERVSILVEEPINEMD